MTKSSKSLPSRIQLKVIMTATNNVKANCSSGSSFWLSNLFFLFLGVLYLLLVVYRMWWPTINCANDRLDLNFKSFEWQNPTLDKISFVSQRNKISVHTHAHHATHELLKASLKNSCTGFYDSAKLHLIVSKHTQENWFWKRR